MILLHQLILRLARIMQISFEANEVKNLGECNISLPEWSLAGDGYTVSIQKKAI